MRKVRFYALILAVFGCFSGLKAQEFFREQIFPADTMKHQGLSSAQEAADTLWSRLSSRKMSSLLTFTLSDSQFYRLVRKTDTVTTGQLLRGQWISYWHKVEKSYAKAYKSLRKKKISLSRSNRDTLLISGDAANPGIKRCEIWLSKGKTRGYIRYYVVRFEGQWYFLDKVSFVEDQTRLK